MRSRRTSPRRGCGRIMRRGRTANSPEPSATRFDQPGLGSLLLLPNESSSSKSSSWAGKGLLQMLLSSPLPSKANQASPSRLGSPQPPARLPGLLCSIPKSHSPSLGKQRCASPNRLCSSTQHLHSALLLTRQSCRENIFPAPPRTGMSFNRRFFPYQSWACGSLEVDSTAPLAGLCQKAHLERGGKKRK